MNSQKTLNEKSVVLSLLFRAPGMRRKGDLSSIDTDADKELLGLSTLIIDSEEYRAVAAIARDCRAFLKAREVPTPMLRTGMHRIPIAALDAIYSRIQQAESEYVAKANEFCAAYPELCKTAEQRLRSQYNPANYPPVDQIRKAFSVEWKLLDFGVPEEGKLGTAIHEAEWEKAKEDAKEEAEQCRQALRTATLAIVERFAKALGSQPGGKKGVLTDKGWEKIEQFLKLFEDRNVLQDEQCDEYVKQLKAVVDGNDPGTLRKHDDLRTAVEAKVQTILSGVSGLVEAKPRAISFSEDL